MGDIVRDVWQVEIRSRRLAEALAFYRGLFDWEIHQVAPDYALVDPGRAPAISVMEVRDPDFPLGVCNLVLVEDCAKEAERAVALGGQICVNKWPVPGSGWYTGTLDPWGNEVFFWEQERPGKPGLKGSRRNPVALVEIPTTDLEAGVAYYRALLGWSFEDVSFGESYRFTAGCGLERGVGLVAGDFARRARPTIDYVLVDDLERTAAQVRERGGEIVVGPSEVPGEDGFFVFEDREKNRMGALRPA